MKYLFLIFLAALPLPTQATELTPELCLEFARTYLIASEANSPQTGAMRVRLRGCFVDGGLGASTVALIRNDRHIQYTLTKAEETENKSDFSGM
jgi:hypothetical protein